jgi:ribosomal protein S18 acetylase RimI-like enzyme
MEYKLMEPHHVDQVAEIHIEGQPGTLLTNLGKPFLATLYREICDSEWGFGVVALDNEIVAGVGILTTSTSRLFRDLKRRRGLQLLLLIIPRLLTHPHLLLDVYQSWRYPAKMGAGHPTPASDNGAGGDVTGETPRDITRKDAEFLFLGVRKVYQGQKIGSGIFDASVALCKERGIDHLTAVVEHTNWRLHQKASHHVARYGWRRLRQIELNGRLMDVIEMDLSHELAPDEWGPGTLDPDVLPDNESRK